MKIVCQFLHQETGARSEHFVLDGNARTIIPSLIQDGISLDSILVIPLLHLPESGEPVISQLPIVTASQLIALETPNV